MALWPGDRRLETAVRLAPGNAVAWGALARAAVATGREREAVGYWQRARTVDERYFDARHDEQRQLRRLVRRVGRSDSAGPVPAPMASLR